MVGSRKDLLIKAIWIVILCFVIEIALSSYAQTLDRELHKEVKSTLKEVSVQSVYNLNAEVKSQMGSLTEIAERIGDVDHYDSGQAVEILKEIISRYPFKRMGIIKPDGIAYTTDDTSTDLSDRDFFKRSMNGENVLSERLTDYFGGGDIVVFSTPIYVKGQIEAVLFATYAIEEFGHLLKVSSFEDQNSFCIVQSDGDVIVEDIRLSSEKESIPDEETDLTCNVFQSLLKMENSNREAVGLLENMLAGNGSGSVEIFLQEDCYLQVAPLEINDWFLLNIIPTSVMDETRNEIMKVTYVLFFCITILAAILIFYIMWSERQKNRQLERILYVDHLTGAASYQKFLLEAQKKLLTMDRSGAFIVMDIDQFKLINELFGYQKGDETLRFLDRQWKEWIHKDELYARKIADQFVVMAFYDNQDEFIKRVEDFIAQIINNKENIQSSYVIRPALGIYLIQDETEDIQYMLNNAAMAHYSIKGQNNGHFGIFDKAFKEKTLQDKLLEDQLELAYQNNELYVFYQPQYHARTGEMCGAEALVRWIREDGTFIPPYRFIPLAEKKGFITRIDKYVFRQVCGHIKSWMEEGMEPVPISVNVSREHLKNERFVDEYSRIQEENSIPIKYLQMELTESALFDNMHEIRSISDKLHQKGVRIMMDDFGTGYSSLMMLKTIPIDVLKLDKSFVDDYNDPKGEKIIDCVIGLAKSLDIEVTAEGVETKEQYEFLRDKNCDVIQGYYFARPMPEAEFRKLLKGAAECKES